jgi:hypothetical protein
MEKRDPSSKYMYITLSSVKPLRYDSGFWGFCDIQTRQNKHAKHKYITLRFPSR